MPMTETNLHPDDETLAAYVDGTLSPPQREDVTQHLASCEDCYEIFAETARFLHEQDADSKSGDVVPFRRRGVQMPARSWIAVAAVLLVALLGAWLLLRGGSGPTDPLQASSGELLALLDAEARNSITPHLWRERASGSAFSNSLLDPLAFSVGVHLVDAQAALETGDDETTRKALEALALILAESPDVDLSGAVSDLGRAPKRTDLEDLESRLAGELPAGPLARGRFVETARLAAAAGSEEFFQRPEVQDAFERIRRSELVEPVDGDRSRDNMRQNLETIRTSNDLRDVEEALADWIRVEGV